MTAILELLHMVDGLSAWFWALPRTALFLIYGVLLTYSIAAGGYVLARCGIKPLWILSLLAPTFNLCGLWLWAYRPWPVDRRKEKA